MKKMIALILALALACTCFVACGQQQPTNESTPAGESTPAAGGEQTNESDVAYGQAGRRYYRVRAHGL